MSTKLNPIEKQIMEQIVRLFNLKGRKLPESDRMREWIAAVYKGEFDHDILVDGVDALSRDPAEFFNVGDLLSLCRGQQFRRDEEKRKEEMQGKREHDPDAESVAKRCRAVFDKLPLGQGGLDDDEALAMWEELKSLADEMIDFYSHDHRATDAWKKERVVYIGKIINLEERIAAGGEG